MNEAHEVDEMPAYAVRKRALKSGRKKKEKQSKADPKGQSYVVYSECILA